MTDGSGRIGLGIEQKLARAAAGGVTAGRNQQKNESAACQHGRVMNRIAAKIPNEVGVLVEIKRVGSGGI